MNRMALLCLFTLMSLSCFAETPVVKDRDGNIIGYLIDGVIPRTEGIGFGDATFTVLTADEVVVRLRASSGRILSENGWKYFYESDDCTGPELVSVSTAIPSKRLVYANRPKSNEFDLYFLHVPTQILEYTVQSLLANDLECQVFEPVTNLRYLLQEFLVENPADFGLTESPVYAGWGFEGPLTLGLQKPDLIHCSGFENCPTE